MMRTYDRRHDVFPPSSPEMRDYSLAGLPSFLAVALAGATSSTVSPERIFATDLSPKPLTFFRSSTVVNGPFFSRYAMIASAFFGPTPFTASNAALLAVFRLTAAIAMPEKVKNAININSNFFIVFPFQKSNDTHTQCGKRRERII